MDFRNKLVRGMLFQPSLMFADKAGAYQIEAPVRCSTLGLGSWLLIRLGWKGLPGTNTLAYQENPQITENKRYYGR
jgi:hypothetical protein